MANVPLKSITFPGLSDTYTVPQIDNTLTTSGKAADAKVTGDQLNDLKSAVDDMLVSGNILNNCEEYKIGYMGNTVTPAEASSYSVYTYIPVTASTAYKCNFPARWVVYMGTNKQGSGQTTTENLSAGTSFTPTYNGYVHITVKNTENNYANAKACLSSVDFDIIAKYGEMYMSSKYVSQSVSDDCADDILSPVRQSLNYAKSYKVDDSIYFSGTLSDVTSSFSVTDGEFIRANGNTAPSSGYQRTGYIDIEDIDGVTVKANYSSGIAAMIAQDASQNILGTVTESIDKLFTAFDLSNQYPNIKYVRFSTYYGSDNSKKLSFKKFTGTKTVSEKIQELDGGIVSSPLYGKKLAVDGDSICAGAGYTGGYAKIIGEKYSMTVQNLGVGGATLAVLDPNPNNKHIICTSIADLDDDADYIIVEGGVNDSANGVSIGNFTSGYNNTLQTQYFYGAIESVCKQLSSKFAGKKYGFLIPHQMQSKMSPPWNDTNGQFYEAILKACTKWGVPVLDLTKEVPPFEGFANSGNSDLIAVADEYTADTTSSGHGDGWHPNQAGYTKYYVDKIVAWLETL